MEPKWGIVPSKEELMRSRFMVCHCLVRRGRILTGCRESVHSWLERSARPCPVEHARKERRPENSRRAKGEQRVGELCRTAQSVSSRLKGLYGHDTSGDVCIKVSGARDCR
jgi:hypothetical protein